MRFPTVFVFSVCLAQVLAHGWDQNQDSNSNQQNAPSQSDRNSTESSWSQQRHQDNSNNTGFNNAAVTITVTATQQAQAALTVMTVTVTQSQSCAPSPPAVGGSGPSLVFPPPPNNASVPAPSITSVRRFLTNGAVQVGLTSIPVAVASSLGQDSGPAPPQPGLSNPAVVSDPTSMTVSSGVFATVSQSSSSSAGASTVMSSFSGTTFVTEASLLPGLSSIPVADSQKSAT